MPDTGKQQATIVKSGWCLTVSPVSPANKSYEKIAQQARDNFPHTDF